MKNTLRTLSFSLLLAWSASPAMPQANPGRPLGTFGVMVHYLPAKGSLLTTLGIDAEQLASDLARMRASYLVLTLGQNNGQYIAPNRALSSLCPAAGVFEPSRDQPEAIGQALRRYGIGLVLYLPFRSPQSDPYLMECLGDTPEMTPTNAAFIANWASVVAYWSQRYGALAKGWWFDGTYNVTGMSAKDWMLLCAAANQNGNERWIAFNAGEGVDRFYRRSAPCQNYMAGEMLNVPEMLVAPSSDLTFHVLTPLTAAYGQPGEPQYSRTDLRRRIARARWAGGMFTLDMPLNPNLRLYAQHVHLVEQATKNADSQP